MKIKRQLLALTTAAAISGSAGASGIPVLDAASLIQTTVTALNSVEQVMNQVKMVANQAQQLKTLDGQIMGSLDGALGGQASAVVGLLKDVTAMKYDWDNSRREFDQLFGDNGAWKAANPAAYATFLERSSQQVKGAARSATQAQQVLNNVEKYNRANKQAIDAAAGADGDVRQMQAANLQLSTVNAQLSDLIQLEATAARAQATQAVAAQAKADADRVAIERMSDPGNIVLDGPTRSKKY